MGFAREALFLFLICAAELGVSLGAVYHVGDSAGWTTTVDNLNYQSWAASKTFKIGDTLIFQYEAQLHNVVRVSRSDFHTCIATSPIATYSTGNDTVMITKTGHYYFICGVPGHCEAGQKVDIRVPKNSSETPGSPKIIPTRGPLGLSPEPLASGLLAPSPAQNGVSSLIYSRLETILLVIGLCVVYVY